MIAQSNIRLRAEQWGRKLIRLPFLAVFAVALFLQIMGEQFPFSNFPMYAGLVPRSEFIYFTDHTGKKVGTWWWFGEGGAAMMKTMRTVWRRESEAKGRRFRQDEESQIKAANHLFDTFLAKQPPEKQARILATGPRMVYVEILVEDGRIVLKEKVVVAREPVRLR